MVGGEAGAFPPPKCRSFSSTTAFSGADNTTGLIGRWIHQIVMKTVATTSNNKASKLPHPYSSQRIFFAGGGGTEGGGGGPGGDEVFGDMGEKVSLVNVWSGGNFP